MARVAIVFDRDYAEHLEELAFRTPVWLVDTEPNRAAAQHAWQQAQQWPQIDVTLFHFVDWPTLIDNVQLRRGYESVDVIGNALTDEAVSAFQLKGFARVHETENGFRARMSF